MLGKHWRDPKAFGAQGCISFQFLKSTGAKDRLRSDLHFDPLKTIQRIFQVRGNDKEEDERVTSRCLTATIGK